MSLTNRPRQGAVIGPRMLWPKKSRGQGCDLADEKAGFHWLNVGASQKSRVRTQNVVPEKGTKIGFGNAEARRLPNGQFLNREVACQVGKVETGFAKGACQKCKACERTTGSRAVTLEEFQM